MVGIKLAYKRKEQVIQDMPETVKGLYEMMGLSVEFLKEPKIEAEMQHRTHCASVMPEVVGTTFTYTDKDIAKVLFEKIIISGYPEYFFEYDFIKKNVGFFETSEQNTVLFMNFVAVLDFMNVMFYSNKNKLVRVLKDLTLSADKKVVDRAKYLLNALVVIEK